MATGLAAPAPSAGNNIADQRITLSPVGTIQDTTAKLVIDSIGITPLPIETLAGFGQGIYVNINA
jgi:hypothetical protein